MEHEREFLEKELDRVDKWLSFAEAKNAALAGFNIAVLGLSTKSECCVLIAVMQICFVVSTVLVLISFLPKSNSNAVHTNLIFYADIDANFTGSDYLSRLQSGSTQPGVQADIDKKINADYAEEIVINSNIAVRKYKWFKRALLVDFIGLVALGLLFICA